MARKKIPEEPVNHERWLVSYADFITLLFAFFVVMYSISSVNEGKYRVLSDSISAAFDPTQSGLPIKLISPVRPPIVDRNFQSKVEDAVSVEGQYPALPSGPEASEKDKINLRKISQQVVKSLSPLVNKKLIKLTNNDLWIEIEIKSSILFPSGSARLSPKARPVLRKIGEILGQFDNQIQVEGFTDNVPIDTDEFPSNWELSSARAASVVHLLAGAKLDPRRLSAVGYGEYKPITSNETPKGRRKNRRISIVVLSDAIARTANRTEQLEKALAGKRKAKATLKPGAAPLGAPVNLLPPRRQER
ncbi:MAG: flagellar motor protein MotD [Gammaproteobacteria bacterium]|nr:flagellar motor protein MotD [Gammaproteobacteria bacterium]